MVEREAVQNVSMKDKQSDGGWWGGGCGGAAKIEIRGFLDVPSPLGNASMAVGYG